MFSSDYIQARNRFRETAIQSGFELDSREYKGCLGADNEILTIDIAAKGTGNQLVLTSGLHGVEGYVGSACQIDCMKRAEVEGYRTVLIHGINPYGFSHKSRVNENGVDLNRNCGPYYPVDHNRDYDLIQGVIEDIVLSQSCPNSQMLDDKIMSLMQTMDPHRLTKSISTGQFRHPSGIFYGGTEQQHSFALLDELLSLHLDSTANQTIVMDVHSGLGAAGVGELIYTGLFADKAHQHLNEVFPDVVCSQSGGSVANPVSGSADLYFQAKNIGKRVAYVALEFGTLSDTEVLKALLFDAWLRAKPTCSETTKFRVRETVFKAFCVASESWQRAVFQRSRAVVESAAAALKK